MPPAVVIEKGRAPVEKVFDFIARVETHPRIADFRRSVRIASEKRSGAGTLLHQACANGVGRPSEIIAREPNEKIAWRNFEGEAKAPFQASSHSRRRRSPISGATRTVLWSPSRTCPGRPPFGLLREENGSQATGSFESPRPRLKCAANAAA